VNDLYNGNNKSLEKTLKETSVDEKISSAHGLAELML
jgi:hypothetical protein